MSWRPGGSARFLSHVYDLEALVREFAFPMAEYCDSEQGQKSKHDDEARPKTSVCGQRYPQISPLWNQLFAGNGEERFLRNPLAASGRTWLPRATESRAGQKSAPRTLSSFLDRVAGSWCEGLFSPAIGKHWRLSVYLRFVAARLTYRHSPRNPFW